ncbi:hypothetical protein ACJMK2_021424 [Sinanodonta woodiana]|uniref:Transient receptor potential cation channel subfamily A member 1 n=1 Tax=Sinanodonta woodiana TaxID=1069815 RepID=A0ABD3TH01_SINWO
MTSPDLLQLTQGCNRDNSTNFRGQTPLHMVICIQNIELVKHLFDAARKIKPDDNKLEYDGVKEVLSQRATCLKFKNNVLMAQLPLLIAALTDNERVVKLLLEHKETDVYQENSHGDNICHSLLKYANIIPDREDDSKDMTTLINEEKKDCCKMLVLMPNKNNKTPLIFAVKYGQLELFGFILEDGYCTTHDSSGLFDVMLYDMTDIDYQLKECRRQQEKKGMETHRKDSDIKAPPTEKEIGVPSVFDLIFHHFYKTSLSFVKQWRHYCKFIYIGFVFHIIIMSVLTAAAVERVKSQRTVTINQSFPAYFSIIMTIICPLYIRLGCFKIVQICGGKFQIATAALSNPYANAIFQVLFFYICTVCFCFFTSLIQRVLLQDITRFAPIIALQLVAFSTAMFMLLHSPTNQTFLGFADIEIGDSSQPILFSVVFIIFVIMTTILMLNALIASMSSTCTDLLQNFTPDVHLYLQQLAVILFFEGILPNKFTHKYATIVTKEVEVDTYDRSRKKLIKMKRHLMRIDVIDEDDEIGGTSEAYILPKLHKCVQDTRNGNNKSSETSLTDQFNGTRSLQRIMKSTKSSMSNTAEHLDGRRTLDIYHHLHPVQQDTI